MKLGLVFHYRAQPSRKQNAILAAVTEGAERQGDMVLGVEGFHRVLPGDGAILFGIGGIAKSIYDAYRAAGIPTILIDKGYTRNEHYRVAVKDFQPLAYMQERRHPGDRFKRLKIELKPYEWSGDAVLFDGASNKFAMWKDLGDYRDWGAAMVMQIRAHTDRPIIYRPRPTHNEDHPVPGAEFFAGRSLDEDFARAYVVVSYGGNIGWDAAVAGLPHFAIGDSIARPISETEWANVAQPRLPSDAERLQWACDVAYQQWNLEEFRSGEAWDYIRRLL